MTMNVKILNKILAKQIRGHVKRFTHCGRVGSTSASTAQHPQINVTNPINGREDENRTTIRGCRKAPDNVRHPFMVKLSASGMRLEGISAKEKVRLISDSKEWPRYEFDEERRRTVLGFASLKQMPCEQEDRNKFSWTLLRACEAQLKLTVKSILTNSSLFSERNRWVTEEKNRVIYFWKPLILQDQ